MLQVKVQTENIAMAGDMKCACREECGQHPGEICLDPVDLLLDLGRGLILAACSECAKAAVALAMEKLLK